MPLPETVNTSQDNSDFEALHVVGNRESNENILFPLMRLKKPKTKSRPLQYFQEILNSMESETQLIEGERAELRLTSEAMNDGMLEPIMCNGTEIYVVNFRVTRITKFTDGLEDVNHAPVKFIYWYDADRSPVMYASVKSRRTSLWKNFLKFRDYDHFIRKMPKCLLSPAPLYAFRARGVLGENQKLISVVTKSDAEQKQTLIEKCAVIKSFNAKLAEPVPSEIACFVANNIPWQVQVGQVKIPVKADIIHSRNDSALGTMVYQINHLIQQGPKNAEFARKWDELFFLEQIEMSAKCYRPLVAKIKADIMMCTEKKNYKPKYIQKSQVLKIDPENAFLGCTNVKLMVQIGPDYPSYISWKQPNGDTLSVKTGSDITVEDLIRTLPKLKQDGDRKLEDYYLEWNDGTSPNRRFDSIIDAIDANLLETFKYDKIDNNVIKVGSFYYRVHPEMIEDVQERFQQTLNQTLFDPTDKPFPICWNQSPPEERTFTLEDFKIACSINGSCTSSNDDEIKNILTKSFSIVDDEGNNMLDKNLPMNCCVVPKEKQNAKLKSNIDLLEVKVNNDKSLNKLLFQNDQILNSEIKSGYNILTKERSMCQWKNGAFTVITPALTKDTKKALELCGFCVPKTLQFLKSFALTKLNEGEYNELYHLSNCPCHGRDWTFIVGDRILSRTKNIELFDVLAYNGKLGEVYLLHTKLNANTYSIRECSSQVRVCENELKKWYSNKKSSVLREMYDVINSDTSHFEGDFIHRLCAKQTLNNKFKNAEDFYKKIKRCHVKICMALADKTASKWKDFKYINFHCNLRDIVNDDQFLNKLKELKFVKPDDCMDLQLAQNTPKQFKSKCGENPDDLFSRIFNGVAPEIGNHKKVRELLTSPSIPKMEIVILNDNFNKTLQEKVSLCIMPINTGGT